MPGRSVAPSSARAANPTPPAAPAPGESRRSAPVAAATASAQWPTARVQLLDVVGVGALLRPVHRGGAVRSGQRVVHVAGHHDLGAGQAGVHPGQVEPVDVGQSAATVDDLRAVGGEQPARRAREPCPAPPSVPALPPMPTTIRRQPASRAAAITSPVPRRTGGQRCETPTGQLREPGDVGQFDHGHVIVPGVAGVDGLAGRPGRGDRDRE